jgi:hypothetical protein
VKDERAIRLGRAVALAAGLVVALASTGAASEASVCPDLPSPAPTAYPAPSSVPSPAASLAPFDRELEHLLPSELGDMPLLRLSTRGTDTTNGDLYNTRLVVRFGKGSDDFTQAYAVGTGGIEPTALRVRGVDGDQLVTAWLEIYDPTSFGTPSLCSWHDVRGRPILRIETGDEDLYALLPVGDALVILHAYEAARLDPFIEATVDEGG